SGKMRFLQGPRAYCLPSFSFPDDQAGNIAWKIAAPVCIYGDQGLAVGGENERGKRAYAALELLLGLAGLIPDLDHAVISRHGHPLAVRRKCKDRSAIRE